MPVRLQFVREDAITSRLIAWMGAGEFSHVDAVLDDGSLLGARHDRIGGKPPGVQIRPPNYAMFTRRAVFTLNAGLEQAKRFNAYLLSQIGKPYDMSCIYGFITGRNWRRADSWICSELQAVALETAHISPPLYLAAYKVSPCTLATVASALDARRVDFHA